ncbi:MAG: hypothetical protein WC214_02485 [Candidatus Omnitrophota bacterium]
MYEECFAKTEEIGRLLSGFIRKFNT